MGGRGASDRQRQTKERQAPLYREEEEVAVNMEEGNLLKAHCVASLDSRSQTELRRWCLYSSQTEEDNV